MKLNAIIMEEIGIVGAGAMGSGIAQVAATAGHRVILFDANRGALDQARSGHRKIFDRLVEKGKWSEEQAKTIQAKFTLPRNAP